MKKRTISKILVTTMAMTMMFGSALTVHAEYWDDGLCHGDGGVSAGYDDGSCVIESGNSSSDSGSSSSGGGESYSEPSQSYDSGNDSQDSGGSYSAPANGGSASSSASVSTPAVTKAAGGTTGVTGKEQFRALAKSGAGTYKVTHKGNVIATFSLQDKDGNAASCTAVALKQRTDGKWAIDFQVTEKTAETTKAADTTGFTVGAPLDRTYMYDTLGVSYITINDTVIIDIEAESAAAKAAK